MARLNRFKLRVKADIEPRRRCERRLGPSSGSGPGRRPVADAGRRGRRVPRSYERCASRRACRGMGAELTEKTIPAEAGIVDRTVSFTKGCFTGQELVARIDSRGGNVPRRLRGVVLERPTRRSGRELVVGGQGGRRLTSVCRRRGGLAYVARGRSSRRPTPWSSWDGGSVGGPRRGAAPSR